MAADVAIAQRVLNAAQEGIEGEQEGIEREQEAIERLIERAVAERRAAGLAPDAAVAAVQTVLWTAMEQAIARFKAGEVILPAVLGSAEVVHRARRACGTNGETKGGGPNGGGRGSIVVATVEGDVHDIGKSLLVSLLANTGYTVHDLGKQVAVEQIVQAAADLQPDAVGLSALLVTSSREMPRCIVELDRRGVRVPVLIGGAAINRAFGRRAAILPDGRVYQPGVVYCRDVFEGLEAMAALTDPDQRGPFLRQVRGEVGAEQAGKADRAAGGRPAGGPPPRSDVPVPAPPFWGVRRVQAGLDAVWRHLDLSTLYRYHWGGYRARGADYDRIVHDVFEPMLAALQTDAQASGWIEPLLVRGYFRAQADGDQVVVFDAEGREQARLAFPRQPDGERLCLADYFRRRDSGEADVLALQAVSCGPRAGQAVERLQQEGAYRRMLFTNGLASATAEAMAEFVHALIRHELGLPAGQGLRFSWGYGACPDLQEQHKILSLLGTEAEIGLRLSGSGNLDPEHSTAAMVVHHPEAKYFSVREAA